MCPIQKNGILFCAVRFFLLIKYSVHFTDQDDITNMETDFFCVWKWTLLSSPNYSARICLRYYFILSYRKSWKNIDIEIIHCKKRPQRDLFKEITKGPFWKGFCRSISSPGVQSCISSARSWNRLYWLPFCSESPFSVSLSLAPFSLSLSITAFAIWKRSRHLSAPQPHIYISHCTFISKFTCGGLYMMT